MWGESADLLMLRPMGLLQQSVYQNHDDVSPKCTY